MSVLRPITPEQEAGLAPVGWSWERDGGMVSCFASHPGWDFERPERNEYWTAKGFTAPRLLYFQTPVQKVAPELLKALEDALDSLEYVERHLPGLAGCGVRQERISKSRAAIAAAKAGDA